MTDDAVDPNTPEGRMADVAAALWDAASERYPDQVADAQALIELDPSLRGMRVHYDADADRYDFVWTGRLVGSVDGAYIRDGLPPASSL